VRAARPGLARRFAMMSGAAIDEDGVPFLPKPFTRRQLADLMDALLRDR